MRASAASIMRIICPSTDGYSVAEGVGGMRARQWPAVAGCVSLHGDAFTGRLSVAVNFAVSAAKAHRRAAARDTRVAVKQAAAGWRVTHREQRGRLREMGVSSPSRNGLATTTGPTSSSTSGSRNGRGHRPARPPLRPPTPKRAPAGPGKPRRSAFLTRNIGWNCLNADAIRRMKTQRASATPGPPPAICGRFELIS
jgi:hypothetical protein